MNYNPPKPIHRFALFAMLGWAVLVNLAGAQTPPTTPSANDAETLLAQAVEAARQHRSVIAKLRFSGRVLDEAIVGTGQYWQGPPQSQVWRQELKLQISSGPYSLQQISDGTTLWIQRNRGKTTDELQVNVARVLAAESARPQVPTGLPLGGVPRLLENLLRSFQFRLRPGRHELYGVPMIVLEGTWKPESLAKLLPGSDGANPSKLPAHLPDQIVLYLGPDDRFPYRVEYRRSAGAKHSALGTLDAQELVLELYEVQFNVLLQRNWFQFESSSTPPDITAQWIERQNKL